MSVNAIARLKLLRSACGVAPVSLLCCPNESCAELASVVRSNEDYKWARSLLCENCGEEWQVCVFCGGSRAHLVDETSMIKHERRYHKKEIKRKSTEVEEVPVQSCRGFLALPHGSRSMSRYFWDNQTGDGPACLVARSHFCLDGMQSQLTRELTREDVKMGVSLCRLVLLLSREQNEDLAGLLRMVVRYTQSSCSCSDLIKENVQMCGQVPTNYKDLRKKFLHGRFAMIPSLPTPTVKFVDENHAYVSLHECIQDLFMHGVPVEPVGHQEHRQAVKKISESRMASIFYHDAINKCGSGNCYALWFNEWSDDFEPNSMNKSNRGSVWIKCITISCLFEKRNSMCYTYPIAVGPKGVSHEPVERELAREMAALRGNGGSSGFYMRGRETPDSLHARMMVSLQDQPERRGENHILSGRGKYSARWRYSCDVAAIAHALPSCPQCFKTLKQGKQPIECQKCTNWSFDGNNDLLEFDPPDNFPASELPLSGKLRPQEMTYDKLRAAVKKTYDNIVAGTWTTEEGRAYLAVNVIKTETQQKILDHADRAAQYKYAEENKERLPQQFELLRSREEANPGMHQMWPMPTLWNRGIDLIQHVDVMMHLVFEGIVKTNVEDIQEWQSSRGKREIFLRFAKGILESVQCLNLPWCKVLPYSKGKLGGWIAENFLGFARVAKWFYSRIDLIADDPLLEEPPYPQSRWNMKVNKQWLRLRGLCTDGKAADLRKRVDEYMNAPEGAPPVMPPCGGTSEEVKEMVVALVCMVSRLMTRTVTDDFVSEVERSIKIYLTLYHLFDEKLHKNRGVPSWVSKYNFLSLLNLPKTMELFGPLRNFWEGGNQGEGILRHVKPEITMGLRKNWQVNLIQRVLHTRTVEQLMIEITNPSDRWTQMKLEEDTEVKRQDYRCYPSHAHVLSDFGMQKPLSVIKLIDGTIGCALRRGKIIPIKRVSKEPDTVVNKMCYYTWRLVDVGGNANRTFLHSDVVASILLLPLLEERGLARTPEARQYAAIDSTWKEMHADGNFCFPDY